MNKVFIELERFQALGECRSETEATLHALAEAALDLNARLENAERMVLPFLSRTPGKADIEWARGVIEKLEPSESLKEAHELDLTLPKIPGDKVDCMKDVVITKEKVEAISKIIWTLIVGEQQILTEPSEPAEEGQPEEENRGYWERRAFFWQDESVKHEKEIADLKQQLAQKEAELAELKKRFI